MGRVQACVLAEGGGIIATWPKWALADAMPVLALDVSRLLGVHRGFLSTPELVLLAFVWAKRPLSFLLLWTSGFR